MFFVSFSHMRLNGVTYNVEMLKDFVREYRALARSQRDAVVSIIQEYCNPNNFYGDKTDKRDFSNWKNESQQIFSLLEMTVYFEYDRQRDSLSFMVKSGSVFTTQDDLHKLKRSLVEKQSYLFNHKIQKELGFELHHIVPLLWAKNATHFFLLDRWQNMVYIDALSHAKITQKGNVHTILSLMKTMSFCLIVATIQLYCSINQMLYIQ